MSTVIFTMAGESRRFRDAGYSQPKYRLSVGGRSLLSWSVESVSQFVEHGWNLLFIGRRQDVGLAEFIATELPWSAEVLLLDEPTDGQASTALRAAGHVKDDSAIAIYNIDTHISPTVLSPLDVRGDGWIPCFSAPGSGWSFLDVDATRRVREVREKVRISDHCTVGFYYFSTFSLFQHAYQTTNSRVGSAELEERYVAPLYNALIAEGREVFCHCLPENSVVPLGTPEEVRNSRLG